MINQNIFTFIIGLLTVRCYGVFYFLIIETKLQSLTITCIMLCINGKKNDWINLIMIVKFLSYSLAVDLIL